MIDAQSLRIAGVDPELSFAGGESQVLGLTLALMGAGHRADLICDPGGANSGNAPRRPVSSVIRCGFGIRLTW